MAESPFASVRIRSYSLDNTNWTPISVTKSCLGASFRNGGTDIMFLRTDANDAATMEELAPGEIFTINARQSPAVVSVYAKTTSTTGPIKVNELTNGVP